MPSVVVTDCVRRLNELGLSIAFAESATGGRLASEFCMVSNAGRVVKGGIVCYAVEVKERLLDISPALIEQFTAESAEVTRELAVRLRAVIPADITVAITGLPEAGGSETPEKPVGTMFIHSVSRGKETAIREIYTGTPEEIILKAIERVAGSVLAELRTSRSLTIEMLGIRS